LNELVSSGTIWNKSNTSQGGSMKKRAKPESKSLGTIISEKARAKANTYTDKKRHGLLQRGMSMIYGGSDHAKSAATRR
jgi:hypothetical protein